MEERKIVRFLTDSKYKKVSFQHPHIDATQIDPYSDEWEEKLFLELNNEGLYFLNESINVISYIQFKDMKNVAISLCSRLVSSPGRIGGVTHLDIRIDLDIEIEEYTIRLEIGTPYSFQRLIDQLHKHSIVYQDPLGVIDYYRNMPETEKRVRYLESNFGKIARKNKLENPRWD